MENLSYVPDEETGPPVERKESKIDTKKEDEKKQSMCIYSRQVMCALTISTAKYVITFLIGSTTMLPALLSNPPSNTTYTSEELKWLASIPNLATIPANILASYLTNFVGPTLLLRIGLCLNFLCYLLPVCLPTKAVFWFSRTVHFVLVGIFDVVVVPLIAELSEPRVRGFCITLSEVTGNFAYLYIFTSFAFLDGPLAILCCSLPVLLGFLGSFFVPESPYWLVKHGMEKEAEKSFNRILGSSRMDKKKEMLEETLTCYQNNEKISTKLDQLRLFKKSKNWKPLILNISIFGLREFGGHSIVFYYSFNIFQEVTASIDSFMCMIIIGVIAGGSTILSAFFLIKCGRRLLLAITLIASSASLLTAGLLLFYDVSSKIIPLVFIMVEALMTGIGIGPISFVLLGELTPSEVTFFSTAIVYSLYNVYQFIVVNVTPTLMRVFDIGPMFIAFSCINVATAGLILSVLPETKGKTLTQLQTLFK